MSSILKTRLLAALLPALLAGCMTESDDRDPAAVLPVASLSAIKGAKAAVVVGGNLYVANRDSSANGIAVVDLATEKVVAFHKETLPPNDLAAFMAYTKANADKMVFASGGTGTSSHVSCVMLNQLIGEIGRASCRERVCQYV